MRAVLGVWLLLVLPALAVQLAELGALAAPVVLAQGYLGCRLLGVRLPRPTS